MQESAAEQPARAVADETPRPAPAIRTEIEHSANHDRRQAMQAEGGSRIGLDANEYESRLDRLVEGEETSPFRRIIDRARGGSEPASESAGTAPARPASSTPSRKDLEEPSFLRRLRD